MDSPWESDLSKDFRNGLQEFSLALADEKLTAEQQSC